jgi:Pyruvate/2-oxoacid:ferredoxin oxidoreductase delta subunit
MESLTANLQALEPFLRPLQSFLFLLGVLLSIAGARRLATPLKRTALPAAFALLFYLAYRAALQTELNAWLYRVESPFVPPLLLLVVPALLLPRNRFYRFFLVVPALALIGFLGNLIFTNLVGPSQTGFIGFPVSPASLLMGVTAFLVLVEPFLGLIAFRRTVRLTCFVLLMFGGFLFRPSAAEYEAMIARRAVTRRDVVSFSETTPVMRDDNRLTYLPGAPCRFSADGGYIQGCNMEWAQRLLQLDFRKVAAGSIEETALLSIALAAGLSLLVLLFIGARAWCGWVCPLAAAGDGLDWIRRRFGLPHLRPSRPVKLAAFGSGLSFASFGLLLAAAIPRLDEQGRFLGCKIPLYPFCKICPGQQVCPVAARGPAGYPPLPGLDWMHGFFLISAAGLGLFFVLSFMAGRRLWCRFCPMGMLGGIFNTGGLLALKKAPHRCNGCGVCRNVCPMDIPTVASEMKETDVSSFDCLYCLNCVAYCPRPSCLRVDFAGQTISQSAAPRPPRGSAP